MSDLKDSGRRVFFTADQHYGHAAIIGFCGRPFSSVEEMNESMVNRFNEVVGSEDVVYHLGDFAMKWEAVTTFLPRLHGRNVLVCGNHDAAFRKHRKHAKATRQYIEAGFAEVHQQLSLRLPGIGAVLCTHLPLLSAAKDGRYPEYAPVDHQGHRFLFHGHVHEKWKTNGTMVNVGVDVWDFRPVALNELQALLGVKS